MLIHSACGGVGLAAVQLSLDLDGSPSQHRWDSEGGGGASAEVLKALISSAKEEPSLLKSPETAGTLAMEIGKKLCDLLLQPHDDINLNLPLGDLGLNSLVALELRVWWKQVFAFDAKVLEMLGMALLLALGQHVAN